MTLLNQENMNDLITELKQAVKTVYDKYGLVDEGISTTYFDESAKITLNVSAGTPEERWQKDAEYYGLPTDGIGKEVDIDGKTFVIKGLKKSNRTSHVIATGGNGAEFRLSPQVVARVLNRQYGQGRESFEEAEKARFTREAFMLGIQNRVNYGQVFENNGRTYRIVAIDRSAKKYPLVCEDIDRKREVLFSLSVLYY